LFLNIPGQRFQGKFPAKKKAVVGQFKKISSKEVA
jgi:hypothetical protein